MNNQEKGYYQDNQESIVAKLEELVEYYTRKAEEAKKEDTGRYKMLRGDRMTAKKCLTASRNGDWEKAKEIALYCDTMVRERMPDDFWTFEQPRGYQMNNQAHECSDDCVVNLRDLWESMDMILSEHHPEIREEVMGMWGQAIGNNSNELVFSCDSE